MSDIADDVMLTVSEQNRLRAAELLLLPKPAEPATDRVPVPLSIVRKAA